MHRDTGSSRYSPFRFFVAAEVNRFVKSSGRCKSDLVNMKMFVPPSFSIG